jgi:hypothetical protein
MCRISEFNALRFTPEAGPELSSFLLLLSVATSSILRDQGQVPFETFAHHVDEGPLGVSPEKAGPEFDNCISKASWVLTWGCLPIF